MNTCATLPIKHVSCTSCPFTWDVLPTDYEYKDYKNGVSYICNTCIDNSKCMDCGRIVDNMLLCDTIKANGSKCNTPKCFDCEGIENAPEDDWFCDHCLTKPNKTSRSDYLEKSIELLRGTITRTMRQNVMSFDGLHNIRLYVDLLEKHMKEEDKLAGTRKRQRR